MARQEGRTRQEDKARRDKTIICFIKIRQMVLPSAPVTGERF